MGKAISISEPVYQTIEEVKDQKQHTSFDSALREILHDAGYEIWHPPAVKGIEPCSSGKLGFRHTTYFQRVNYSTLPRSGLSSPRLWGWSALVQRQDLQKRMFPQQSRSPEAISLYRWFRVSRSYRIDTRTTRPIHACCCVWTSDASWWASYYPIQPRE